MTRTIRRLRALLVVTAFLIVFGATGTAYATTFPVTKFADTADGTCDSDCSLREAVIAANANPGADTINVPSGHYTLSREGTFEDNSSTGDLDISGDTTIVGSGARSTIIDGNQIDRVIEVVSPPICFNVCAAGAITIPVSISGVTITGGLAPATTGGGGISVSNSNFSLDLSNSTVTNNSNPDGKGPGFGGGIFSAGPLTVTASTISDNSARYGAGVNVRGNNSASFTNDTISGNNSNGGNGAGVLAQTSGAVRFLNSTIAGNTVETEGRMPVTRGVVHFGGGIAAENDGPIDVSSTNTIIARNTPDDCREAIGTGGHNIDGGGTCAFTGTGDQQNTDPKLAALADNGGPTDTRALLSGSPAIDTADNSLCPSTDQRGVSRPQPAGGTCDIGAFELQFAPVVGKPDLKISEKDSPDPVNLGGTLTYTLTGTNQGQGSDDNVKITDQLPSSVTFLSSDPSQGTCTRSGQKVTCSVGTLPAGGAGAPTAKRSTSAGKTVTVRIRVRPKKLGTIKNVVTISGSSSETTTANNKAAVNTRVIERNRPRLTLSGIPNGCVTGSFSFTVRISDQSSTRATVALDGHTAVRTSRKRFTVRVHAAGLSSKVHTLTLTAVDHYGNRSRRTTSFRRCRRAVLPSFTG
jgi:CSLREA domain-containing protein/uncharacterized repeat protein (TIGR01451 family)